MTPGPQTFIFSSDCCCLQSDASPCECSRLQLPLRPTQGHFSLWSAACTGKHKFLGARLGVCIAWLDDGLLAISCAFRSQYESSVFKNGEEATVGSSTKGLNVFVASIFHDGLLLMPEFAFDA